MITEKSVGSAAKVMLACSLIGMSLFTYIPAVQAVEESEQVNVSQVLSTLKVGSKNLDVSSGALMYKETVDYDVEEIEILTASENSDAVVTINDTKITNGKSEAFLLKTGVNTFTITVSDDEDSQTMYTVEVEREKSDNALLKNLNLSKGFLSFDNKLTSYKMTVANEVDALTVTPEVQDESASVGGATIEYEGESSATVKIKDKAKIAISVGVTKDNNRRTYVLIFEKDIDVEMDEEETVGDVAAETEQAEETNALETTSSDRASINNLRSNSRQIIETQSTESLSFLGRVQSFFRSIFQ
ncbi:cadherin-like beta sandwich domain-containing protein [Peribacillus sp. Hz7]|uniref:cadherin-like beta sandwich domain-containing protein n=1 Tax=Peribacillus sp. Hz7 TaxID=3344873 RepID=UPI0035CA5109